VTIIAPLTRGDIVTSGRRRGVVWFARGDHVVILPIEAAGPALRNDVAVRSWTDLVATGVAGLDLAIRPHLAHVAGMLGRSVIGRLPPPLLAAVTAAVAREIVALAVEAKWRVPPSAV